MKLGPTLHKLFSAIVTVLCAVTLMGFLLIDMVACLTIVLGLLGKDGSTTLIGVLAAVAFGYATWRFANIFLDRVAPDNDEWCN